MPRLRVGKTPSPIAHLELVSPNIEVGLRRVPVQLEVQRDPVSRIGDCSRVNRLVDVVLVAVHRYRVEVDFPVQAMSFKRRVRPAVRLRTMARSTRVQPLRVLVVPDSPDPVIERALPIPAIPFVANVLAYGKLHPARGGRVLVVVA